MSHPEFWTQPKLGMTHVFLGSQVILNRAFK